MSCLLGPVIHSTGGGEDPPLLRPTPVYGNSVTPGVFVQGDLLHIILLERSGKEKVREDSSGEGLKGSGSRRTPQSFPAPDSRCGCPRVPGGGRDGSGRGCAREEEQRTRLSTSKPDVRAPHLDYAKWCGPKGLSGMGRVRATVTRDAPLRLSHDSEWKASKLERRTLLAPSLDHCHMLWDSGYLGVRDHVTHGAPRPSRHPRTADGTSPGRRSC